MASWTPGVQKMSVSRQEVELAKRREAVRLLAWSRELETRNVTQGRFYEERGWNR